MHIDVKSDNAYTRRVDIRYPAKFVQDELVRAFKKLGERARIPGFRPGKVPMGVLEARYGDKVREDVAAALIQRGWTRALNSQQLEPVSRPTVTRQDEIAGGRDFSFTIALEVRPTIDAVSYKGLPVTWPAWQVGEDEISRFIDGQRREQARLAPVEGRAARAGDIVQVSLVARDGDAVVLDEPGTLVRTSNDAWLPGIEHLVVGLSVDEERTGTAHIGAEARHKDLAGRSLDVTVKALAIQEYVVPELDDALAKELGHADVEAYRASVRERLGRGREDWARNMARANLLQALIEANPFEVPASMVEQNLQLLQEELKMQQAYAGRDARSITFTPAQIADLRNRAAFAAKGGLLIESVARQETITTSDADVEAKIVELAASRGQNLESMRAYFSKPEELADLRDRIKEEKTLDWLLSVAVVEQAAPPAAEAPAAVEAPPVEEAPAEEAPKKKRASKKAEAEAAEAAPVEEAPVEEAPKKKRAAKKADAAEPADEAPAAEEAPKKKRSSKKAAEEA